MFGHDGDQTLDANAVAERFRVLAADIQSATGAPQTPHGVAAGCIRIAVENMANAIKKISVQRGHDVTEYTLSCFGGAAGQHACLVADALGMQTVFMHPLAGVLSAYGIGLADVTVMKQRAIEAVLDDRALADLQAPFSTLVSEGRDSLIAQGVAAADITIERRVALKYEGTDSTLQLPVAASAAELSSAFLEQYRVRYGFLMPQRRLVIESISAEAVGATHRAEESRAEAPTGRERGRAGDAAGVLRRAVAGHAVLRSRRARGLRTRSRDRPSSVSATPRPSSIRAGARRSLL